MTLPKLLERVETASGPDRDLGHDIYLACGWRRTCVGHFYGPLYQWNSPANGGPSFGEDKLPDPTASLDAALALVEENLPGWDWQAGSWGAEAGPYGVVQERGADKSFAVIAETPALALLAALFQALIDQEEHGRTPEKAG